MVDESIVQFYFESYKLELDARSAIDARLSFSVGLGTLIVAAPAYYLLNYPSGESVWPILFWLLFIVGSVLLAGGFVLLATAIWSPQLRKYKVIGPLKDVEAYRQGFNTLKASRPDAPEPAGAFRAYLAEDLAAAASSNQDLNVTRSRRWFNGTGAVLAAVACFTVAAIPFFVMRGVGPSETHQTGAQAMPDKIEQQQQQQPTTAPASDEPVNPVPRPPIRDTASDQSDRTTRVVERPSEVKGS